MRAEKQSFQYFQVNAFTSEPFQGNPAAVMPLSAWLPDELMRSIAAENNLSETAFFVPVGKDQWKLRWFTPTTEVKFCGHATLASGFVILSFLHPELSQATFETRVGPLKVRRDEAGLFVLDAPSFPGTEVEATVNLIACFNLRPSKILKSHENFLFLFDQGEAAIKALQPDFKAMAKFPEFGFIATAKGGDVDFVSRYFAPNHGVPEDPVTGSAHSVLVPFWAGVLGKDTLTARQGGVRCGELFLHLKGKRVDIGGKCFLVKDGSFHYA